MKQLIIQLMQLVLTTIVALYAIDFLVFTFPEITLWTNTRFNNDWSLNVTVSFYQSVAILYLLSYKIVKHLNKPYIPKV